MGNYYCKYCGVPQGYHLNERPSCRYSNDGYHIYTYQFYGALSHCTQGADKGICFPQVGK